MNIKKIFILLLSLVSFGAFGQKTLVQLQTDAITIRDETTPKGNTATRVGSAFLDYANSFVPIIDYATASGTNAYSASVNPIVTQYVHGQLFRIEFQGANTGSSTLNLNGLGSVLLTMDGSTALSGGEIKAGQQFAVYYNGTAFQLNGGGGGVTSFNSRTGAISPQPGDYSAFYVLQTSTKTASLNSFSGVDPTGTTECSAAIQTALNNSSYNSFIFDGIYKITTSLSIPTGKQVYLRSGTDVQVATGAGGGYSAFIMTTSCGIYGEKGSYISCTSSDANQYGITIVNGSYDMVVSGPITIRNFGRNGMYFLNSLQAPYNQLITAIVRDVLITGTTVATAGMGDGIKVDAASEYIKFVNVTSFQNAGYGINILGANNTIVGGSYIRNSTGGIRVQGSAGNSDHFVIDGAIINHNIGPGFMGQDIDTGLSLIGCAMFGNSTLFNINNCQGVAFNGCGMDILATNTIVPGTAGDGFLTINGGYSISGTQTHANSVLLGGGKILFNNVSEVLDATFKPYISNFATTDSWTNSNTTGTGAVTISDGSTTFTNTLRIAGDGTNGTHYMNHATTLTIGGKYRLNLTVYIPSANTNVNSFEIMDDGGTLIIPASQSTGKWVTIDTGEFTATGTSLRIGVRTTGTDSFTAPTTDYVYVARMILIKTL